MNIFFPFWHNYWGDSVSKNPTTGYNKPCKHFSKNLKELGAKNKKRLRKGLKVKQHKRN